MDTPVPIPNTEVKHRSGEGIRLGQNSELPGFFLCFNMLFETLPGCRLSLYSALLFSLFSETDFVRERVSEAVTKSSSGQNDRRELTFTEEERDTTREFKNINIKM